MTGSRLVLFAGALGTLAALLVAILMPVKQEGAPATSPSVLVSTATIPAGAAMDPSRIAVRPWQGGGALPAGALSDPDALRGSVARADIAEGRVITTGDIWASGVEGALMPEPGMLAFTARTADIGQVIGFEGPGSRVDVLLSATRNVPQPFSRVVLRGIRVLAVAAETGEAKPDGTAARTSRVTLELSPSQVERIDLARHVGELTLVVRSAAEPGHAQADSPGARVSDLLGRGAVEFAESRPSAAATSRAAVAPPERPADAKPRTMIEEIRGGQSVRREGPA